MCCSFSSQYLASSHLSQHKILVYSVTNDMVPRHTLVHHPRTPWCLTFSPSCSYMMLSGCLGGRVCCWDVRVSTHILLTRTSPPFLSPSSLPPSLTFLLPPSRLVVYSHGGSTIISVRSLVSHSHLVQL